MPVTIPVSRPGQEASVSQWVRAAVSLHPNRNPFWCKITIISPLLLWPNWESDLPGWNVEGRVPALSSPWNFMPSAACFPQDHLDSTSPAWLKPLLSRAGWIFLGSLAILKNKKKSVWVKPNPKIAINFKKSILGWPKPDFSRRRSSSSLITFNSSFSHAFQPVAKFADGCMFTTGGID